MAISDILEALALGGSGAIRGYTSEKQRQAEMEAEERDRIRRALERAQDVEFRERQFAEQKKQAEEQRLSEQRADVAAGRYRPVERVLGSRKEFERMDGVGDLVKGEGGGIGLAAGAAPGQTYAARMQEMERPVTAVSRALDLPELEYVTERPDVTIDGRGYVASTPERVAAIERERKEADEKAERERKAVELEESRARIKAAFPQLNDAQVNALASNEADISDFIVTPGRARTGRPETDYDLYPQLEVARNEVRRLLMEGVETPGERGKYDQPIRREAFPEDIVNTVDQLSAVYGIPPEVIYSGYGSLLGGREIGAERSGLLNRAIGAIGGGMGSVDLFDPEVEDMLRRSLGEDMPDVEMTAGQRRANRNFATDNYLTRGRGG